MRRTSLCTLRLLLLWLSLPGAALSSNCTEDPCKILILDAPYSETVYDPGRFRAGQTNADAISDILRRTLGTRVRTIARRTEAQWLNNYGKFTEIAEANPDLIILHTSAFYFPLEESRTIPNLVTALRYLAETNRAKLLLYGTNFFLVGGLQSFRESLIRTVPQTGGKLSIVELTSRSFVDKSSQRKISQAVAQILNLGDKCN